MSNNSKTVIVGLDGVPFDMIKDFAESGIMPNTARMISEGVLRKLDSTIPEISSVAWSSIITGENPGRHGIFGFTDLFSNTYRMRFPDYTDLQAPPFWESSNGRSVIINVPGTYPVRQLNGAHISGFVSIDLQRSVYPPSLLPKLKELDYRLDVDSQKAHQSIDDFLIDLDETLDARIKTYQYLWSSENWQTFMLVFTGTDRLMHFLWDAYEDRTHKHHDAFLDHFRKIDAAVGEINEKLADHDLFVMLSDHGFERLEKEVYVNYVLIENGYLRFKDHESPALENIHDGTIAFALDPARIYLNLKGKYPRGTVGQCEANHLLTQIEELFGSLEVDGRKVIRSMYRREHIYHGPFLESAPDLILVASEGFNLKAKVNNQKLAERGVFAGKHTQDTAFLLVKRGGGEEILPEKLSVCDVSKIVESVA